MKLDIKKTLSTLDESYWENASNSSIDEKVISWAPVLNLESCTIGLNTEGEWVVAGKGLRRVANLNSYPSPAGLLCLTMGVNELKSKIKQSLLEMKIPEDIEATFPFASIIISAFSSKSKSWIPYALNWLSDLKSLEGNLHIISVLQSFIDSEWSRPLQKERHRAEKFLRLHTTPSKDPKTSRNS